MLVKYASDKREEWDVYLDTCVYAYNISVQESTHFSPLEVMYGRKATMPVDIDMTAESPEDRLQKYLQAKELSPSKVKERATQRCEVLQQVKANIKQAQEKQKEYYDRKRANPSAYKIGGKVLKKDFCRKKRKGGKMDARFTGPYIITQNVGNGLYALQLIEDPTVVVERVNGAHLKPYITPHQSLEGQSEDLSSYSMSQLDDSYTCSSKVFLAAVRPAHQNTQDWVTLMIPCHHSLLKCPLLMS